MNISSIMWIQCVQCRIDICPLCTIQRTQIRTHEYTHKYRIIKSLSFDVDSPGWQMIEELLFVDGLIVHGIGNWEDISGYIGRKSPEEVKQHFRDVFKQPNSEDMEREPVQNVQSLPLSQEISGYMPLRMDFEVEYLNDTEVTIKEISFSKTDTALEKETKEVLLEAYRNILLQRKLFRHLIFNKGLLSAKQHTQEEKSMASFEKDLLSKMKPLLKMLSRKDYLTLFQGLYLELQIRKKLTRGHPTFSEEARKTEGALQKKPSSTLAEDTFKQYLSENEQIFSNVIGIPYAVYYSIKKTAILYGRVTEIERKQILKGFQGLTEQKLFRILNYFMRNKWIEVPI